MSSRRWWLALTVMAGLACESPSGSDAGDSGVAPMEDAGSAGEGLPCDISLVLFNNCTGCHGAPLTASAPMPLLTAEDLRADSPLFPGQTQAHRSFARMTAAAGRMPPEPLPAVSAAELAIFAAYLDAGLPLSTCVPLPDAGQPDAGFIRTDAGTIEAAACTDGVKNGLETDTDCGGGICGTCAPGAACATTEDCTESACIAGRCADPSCGDGVLNQAESDLDCGGAACAPCTTGQRCALGRDCSSGVCALDAGLCEAPTCSDGVQNGPETDVDCGGGLCTRCEFDRACAASTDCGSLVCRGGRCDSPGQCAGEFCVELPDVAGAEFRAVHGVASDALWAVGDRGLIATWDGVRWAAERLNATDDYSGVFMASPTDVWIVGPNGNVVHWDNGAWSSVSLNTSVNLTGVHGVDSTHVWVVGENGFVSAFDGTTWTTQTVPTTVSLNAVSAADPTHVWAVGAQGVILSFDGTTWSSTTTPTLVTLRAVLARSAIEVYAAGDTGRVFQRNSSNGSWSQIFPVSPFTISVSRVFRSLARTQDALWGVADDGLYRRSNFDSWAQVTGLGGSHAVWAKDGDARFVGSSIAKLPDGMTPIDVPLLRELYGVHIFNANDGWVVGSDGLALHWDGERLLRSPTPTTEDLISVHGLNGNQVWAVGRLGTILFWNGTSWTQQTSPTVETLNSVYTIAANNVLAVGGNGVILRFNGTFWATEASNDTARAPLYGVWTGFAVGLNGTILRQTGAALWTKQVSPTTERLNAIRGVTGRIFAVGNNGTVIQTDRSTTPPIWELMNSNTQEHLTSVYVQDFIKAVAVGSNGTVLRIDGMAGFTWQPVVSNATDTFWGVSGTSLTSFMAVGASALAREEGTNWILQVRPGRTSMLSLSADTPDRVWASSYLELLERDAAGWSGEPVAQGAFPSVSSNGRTVAIMDTWGEVRVRRTGTQFRAAPVPTLGGRDLVVNDDESITVVGESGLVLRGEAQSDGGTSWSQTNLPGAGLLLSVASAGPHSVAVGFDGGIFSSSSRGGPWTAQSSGGLQELYAVTVVDGGDAWAVGESGTVLHRASGTWTRQDAGVSSLLRAVWSAGNGEAWAAGDEGLLLHFDGTAWRVAEVPTTFTLNAISGVGDDVYVGGDNGLVLRRR